MDIAILLYPRFTALDAVGPYEVLVRLPGMELGFVAERPGPVTTDTGCLTIQVERSIADVTDAQVLVIPGGPGSDDLMHDGPLHDWIRSVHETTRWTTTVCTGSLILASTGLLRDTPAVTHWLAMDRLGELGAIPTAQRVVTSGRFATAAGVSAGVDLALTIAADLQGDEVAQMIQLGIEYDPQPPFASGSPETAPPEITAAMRQLSRHVMH